MPGGSQESYEALGPILESIAAKVDGEPCCAYMGPDGAGHFVKMVHNGIEYADMQFIAEAYDVLTAAGLSASDVADVFREWNTGELDSFLVEITAEVLDQVDASTGRPLVELIVDEAEQKGTGRWTVQSALELGVPVSAIAEAVFARSASATARCARPRAASSPAPSARPAWAASDRQQLVDDVRDALWSAKVVAYAQGLEQIRRRAQLRLGRRHRDGGPDLARRVHHPARLLKQISDEYAAGQLATLLVAPSIQAGLADRQESGVAWSAAATAGGCRCPASPAPSRTTTPSARSGSGRARAGPPRQLRRAHLSPGRPRGHLPHAVVGRPVEGRDLSAALVRSPPPPPPAAAERRRGNSWSYAAGLGRAPRRRLLRGRGLGPPPRARGPRARG